MTEHITFSKQKLLTFFTFFAVLLFSSFSVTAQTSTGMSISWDKEIGCQIGGVDGGRKLYFTDIEQTENIRFCENSFVTYTIGDLPAGATTVWSATGGTISTGSLSNTVCQVTWGAAGMGNLTFTITIGSITLTKNITIEKVLVPTANFEIAPLGQSNPIYTCSNQALNFINLSTANSGSTLYNYLWKFGDGETSTVFEPNHTYAHDGTYNVSLTVTNGCNCSSTYILRVIVESRGFEISCPSVICEGQSQIYSLPFDGMQFCNNNYNWSVVGGTILSQSGGNVEVLWDSVDASGFGYVTFDPSACNLPCRRPSTVKIPVIQEHGVITGPSTLCLGKQGKYSLPQWPTTEIQWEIIGNVSGNLGEIIQTDQRNEIIVVPNAAQTITLRATYINTLLHCGGEAEFVIEVGKPLDIIGLDAVCQNSSPTYENSENALSTWTLSNSIGAIVTPPVVDYTFSYPFTTPGTYILSVTADGFCAGEEKIITVTGIPAAPTAISGDAEVCPDSPYTYSIPSPDPASDYLWVITNGSFIGSNTGSQVNVTFNGTFPAAVTVYKKSVSPIECLSSPFSIAVNQIPINASISLPFGNVCANSVQSYQAFTAGTTTPFTGGDTYNWSISDPSLGSISNGQGTTAVDVTWNNVTSVTSVELRFTVTKCNISPAPYFTKTIVLNPKTEIVVTSNFSTVCSGGGYPVTFTAAAAPNGPPLVGTDVVTWNINGVEHLGSAGVFTYTQPLNNPSTSNVAQVITAYIANANGCGRSNTASVTVTVLPNPPGIATLTGTANAFCTQEEINTYIGVSSNAVDATFQWFMNGTLLAGETGTSLHVIYPMEFGAYTFEVTNPNGCKTISNPIYISELCLTPGCTLNGSVTNTSYLSACGEITFSGSYTGAALEENWLVLGPDPSTYTVTNNILTGPPGNYKIVHQVQYECISGGGTANINEILDVVIPYEPDFAYTVTCNDNNSFTVNFIDNSTFFAPVSPKYVRFYYKLAGATAFTEVFLDPISNTYHATLSAGNYIFSQEVDGSYPNTITYTCSKEYSVNLQGIDPDLFIIVNQNQNIDCYNTAVSFELSTLPATGTTVLWDFDDASAQNTLPSPSRVFNTPDHTYHVTCTVTNPYGCSETFETEVYIPKKCFFGDVVATPVNATACQGGTVLLTYIPNNDNCTTGANYTWMNGDMPVLGAPNSDQLSVSTNGFYWVKVTSANGCDYDTPTQIRPLFNTLPTVKLVGEGIYCQYQDIKLKVSTNATTIKWFINGTYYSIFDNQTEPTFNGFLPTGDNTVLVQVTSNQGCVNSASQIITILAGLQAITFDVQVQCDPYSVDITVLPTPNTSGITYNWSNGETTQTIHVTDGGAYRVGVTLGGCTIYAEVDVPRNPEDYLWIFPSGCYDDCSTKANTLVGPTLPLPYWSWNSTVATTVAGSGTEASEYQLGGSGLYTLTVGTGECRVESAPLDYSTTRCDKCKIERVDFKDIITNDTPYCSYTYTLVISSGVTFPYQVSLTDELNNVLIFPSTFTLQPGINNLTFTVIPQSPFTGGTTTWTLQGSYPVRGGFVECVSEFTANVPACGTMSNKDTITKQGELLDQNVAKQEFTLYPNPANDFVTLRYNFGTENTALEIYDLSGRTISTNLLTSSNGELQIATSSYASGMYIVVVKQGGVLLAQKKLVIE